MVLQSLKYHWIYTIKKIPPPWHCSAKPVNNFSRLLIGTVWIQSLFSFLFAIDAVHVGANPFFGAEGSTVEQWSQYPGNALGQRPSHQNFICQWGKVGQVEQQDWLQAQIRKEAGLGKRENNHTNSQRQENKLFQPGYFTCIEKILAPSCHEMLNWFRMKLKGLTRDMTNTTNFKPTL